MLRAIIIDDERSGRQVLQQMIEKHCENVSILGTADSAQMGRMVIREVKPDVVFLDIEMPYENGLSLLESYPERTFDVIFVSAHEYYARQVIKYNAADYLLKPVNVKDLRSAVERAERRQSSTIKQ